jgi:hypothetical protein
MGVFMFFIFKGVCLPLYSGELYATGYAATMGCNPNSKTGLQLFDCRKGSLPSETLASKFPARIAQNPSLFSIPCNFFETPS